MVRKFNKAGISIEILMKKIRQEINSEIGNHRVRKIASYQSGKIGTDWTQISLGMDVLNKIVREAFSMLENQLLTGNQDVSRLQKEVFEYRQIINDFIRRLGSGAREEAEIQRRIDSLKDYSQIAQAARDGIIIKQEIRREKTENGEDEIVYDTSMTSNEVVGILKKYEQQLEQLQMGRLSTFMGVGLGIAGIIGTLVKGSSTKEERKEKGNIVGIGTTAMAGVKLVQGILKRGERKEQARLIDLQERMSDDLLGHEQISYRASEDAIQSIRGVAEQERRLNAKIGNKKLAFDVIADLIVAIISGVYVNQQVQIKDNGKIDGKSLAAALVSLQATKEVSRNFLHAIQGIQDSAKAEAKFRETCEKVRIIIDQMDEKVYPLESAKHSFDSIQIRDLNGRFYPKKNYQNGEVEFAIRIKIPEFSMKRGDVVLLSGESGTGKSTFLRLLKRGDINNRHCIELDNGEKVDNLGDEYISFRPSINLGDESNVLSQITGKKNISELEETERQNLIKILVEMNFDPTNLLEQLASKKFMEFSTGQQRRLALSKLFYRIDDGDRKSVV